MYKVIYNNVISLIKWVKLACKSVPWGHLDQGFNALFSVQYLGRSQMLGKVQISLSSKQVTREVQFSNEDKISSTCNLLLSEALFFVLL